MRSKVGGKVRLQHIFDAILEIEIIKDDLPYLKEKVIEILDSLR